MQYSNSYRPGLAVLLTFAVASSGCTWWQDRQARAEIDEQQQQVDEFGDDVELAGVDLVPDELTGSEVAAPVEEQLPTVRVAVSENGIQVDNVGWIRGIVEMQPEYGAARLVQAFDDEAPPFVIERLDLPKADDQEPSDPALLEAFEEVYRAEDEIRQAAQQADGEPLELPHSDDRSLELRVDAAISFGVLQTVLHTAGEAEYGGYDLVVEADDRDIAVRHRPALGGQAGPVRPRAESRCLGLDLVTTAGGTFADGWALPEEDDPVGAPTRMSEAGMAEPCGDEPHWDGRPLQGPDRSCPAIAASDSQPDIASGVADFVDELEDHLAPHCETSLAAADDVAWGDIADVTAGLAAASHVTTALAPIIGETDGIAEFHRETCEETGLRPDDESDDDSEQRREDGHWPDCPGDWGAEDFDELLADQPLDIVAEAPEEESTTDCLMPEGCGTVLGVLAGEDDGEGVSTVAEQRRDIEIPDSDSRIEPAPQSDDESTDGRDSEEETDDDGPTAEQRVDGETTLGTLDGEDGGNGIDTPRTAPSEQDRPSSHELTPGSLRETLSAARDDYRSCYEDHLQDHPDAEGEVEITTTISQVDDRGEISAATTAGDEVSTGETVGDCISEVLSEEQRFELRSPAQEQLDVTVPFRFTIDEPDDDQPEEIEPESDPEDRDEQPDDADTDEPETSIETPSRDAFDAADTLDRDALVSSLEGERDEVETCYQNHLREQPDAVGSVRVMLTISEQNGGGVVTEAQTVFDTVSADTSVGECIAERIENADLELSPPEDGNAHVTVPYHFSPGN